MKTLEDIKKLTQKEYLTQEEVRDVLNYLITTTRRKLNITEDDCIKCEESSMFLDRLCEIADIPYIRFANSELGMKELAHHYGILGLNTEIGQVCFLLDATYMQFNKETYPVENKQVISPGEFIDENIKEQLIKDGFITLTKENAYHYINSFVESYNTLYKIDKNLVINNFFETLKTFNINILGEEYLTDNLKQR